MSVIMMHSIGNDKSDWCQNWLSMSVEHFEQFCKFLQKKKYITGFLDEWYYLENNPEKKNKKQVFLTFDDGYLDNWVFAFPILEKYGLKATIFVNPEFVDPSDFLRPTIKDVWNGTTKIDELQKLGFLNWKEIEFMDRSPYIDIQSHSMSHNYYYRDAEIIDIYEGQSEYHWLPWNNKPERKPFWLNEDQSKYVKYGTPVFSYGRALGLRKYIPNKDFINYAVELYNLNKSDKNKIIDELKKNILNFPGRMENDEELIERYYYELGKSKELLEKHLDKKIDFLCWPGGGYNNFSLQIAEKVGYKASTVASSDKKSKFNNSLPYKRIKRFGLNSIRHENNSIKFVKDKNYVINNFLAKNGHPFFSNLFLIRHYIMRVIDIVKVIFVHKY